MIMRKKVVGPSKAPPHRNRLLRLRSVSRRCSLRNRSLRNPHPEMPRSEEEELNIAIELKRLINFRTCYECKVCKLYWVESEELKFSDTKGSAR